MNKNLVKRAKKTMATTGTKSLATAMYNTNKRDLKYGKPVAAVKKAKKKY